ncbi:GntR family transcriptional regulator [Sporosarcina newyorkensis 2681]|uniref:GntR family transcriptional regulator n=1 Tax=Sporosarcina newyorkensis 2681 TaxID=1027292 RepID=F9DRR0_9BACL|nr:GntR family transcriptional regulator [Sporosarcina newyorkensis]EGQ26563.1 GntR family transcriptional regulator [Sporosarcina newyorkensis 2681]
MTNDVTFDNLNLNDRVYLYLRDQIINNKLQPGTKIEYEAIMKELGISRTPLRDAMNLLQHDKFVEIKPRSGTHVYTPTTKDIEEVYDIRLSLETLAVVRACASVSQEECIKLMKETDHAEKELHKGNTEPFFLSDRNLHRTIIRHSNNSRLIDIMDSLEAQIKWFGIIMTINSERPSKAIAIHRKIIQAMMDSDEENAMRYMKQHIENVREDILADYQER